MSASQPDGVRVDQARLVQVVGGLARRAIGDFTLESLLQDLAVAVADVLEIDGVGVSYHDGEHMRVVHTLPPLVDGAERVQEEDGSGPCHDAVNTESQVSEGELAQHSYRWPRFAEQALAAGLNAVAALPMLGRGRAWGALNLYRREPGPFSAEELTAAQVLTDVACGYVVMAHDRAVAEEAERQAAHAATHDGLTGLPNRALLYDRLNHAVATTSRGRRAMAVIFIDLDGFKSVNDTHGHQAGDELLRQVAGRLSTVVRKGDTLARWGGDEFVVICEALTPGHPRSAGAAAGRSSGDAPQGADEHALEVIVDRLHGVLAASFELPAVVRIGASVGVAAGVPDDGSSTGRDDVDALLRLADEAMYTAKRQQHQDSESTHKVINLLVEEDSTRTDG